MNSDELVVYYIVNQELAMSPGKIAVQVAHVTTMVILNENKYRISEWIRTGQKKIVLRAKEKRLRELVKIGFYYIEDLGLTEIPKGVLTCVSLGITAREEAGKYIKRLQLL